MGATLHAALASTLRKFPKLLEEVDAAHRLHFSELLTRASRPNRLLTTHEENGIVREMIARLEALGVAQPRRSAVQMVQLQSHEDLDEVLHLLRHPAVDRILDTAHGFSTITSNWPSRGMPRRWAPGDPTRLCA